MSRPFQPTEHAQETAASLKKQLEALEDELDFEENINEALYVAASLSPHREQHTAEQKKKIFGSVSAVFINNLSTVNPPGIPLDRRKGRKSASKSAPMPEGYVPPDSPRTAKRKELDRLYPPLEYKPDKKKLLKPLSPRSKMKYEQMAQDIYSAKRGPNGQIMSEDLRTKVQNFKAEGEPDFRDLANEIYHAETPGMQQRAMRNLRHTEGKRDEKAYRQKAFQLYKSDTGQQTFIATAKEINADPHFQKEIATDAGGLGLDKEGGLWKYRYAKVIKPSHIGNYKVLTRNEMKERGMDYLVPDADSEEEEVEEPTEVDPDESIPDVDEMPTLDGNPARLPEIEIIKKRDKALLKKWCKVGGFVFLALIFWFPIFGVGLVATGCDAEERSIVREFDSLNVLSINVIKDRGDVEIEIMPPPTVQGGINGSSNYYSLSAKKSGKIGVTVTHFARTIPALAEIHTEMQQQNGVIYIYNWWDEHFNSLFDCTRSTVKITIPHQINDGIGEDIFTWDRELGEYVWAGTTDTVVEPDISVNITANQPSAWMLPLIGDIVIKGKSDVVLGDVNLTTNGGRVQLEQVTANLIAVDAAAGEINLTMVSSPSMNVMARASRVFGSTVPALPFGNSQTVEVGEIKLQYIDLEAWGPEDSRDRSYKSRVEGYMRPLYNQIIDPDDPTKLIQSPQNIQNGQLTIVSEFGPVSIEDITHGDIHIKVNGESKITPKPAIGQARWTPYGYNFAEDVAHITSSDFFSELDFTGMGGYVSLTMNAFEMQGLYDLNNDDGDIAFELECDEATTDIKRTCTDDGETDCDDADEVKGVYGRIGNVYDMRTFSPMSHRINIDVVSEELSGSSIDITLNMDCTNLKRCPNDCSARGACNPDFGVCSCQPSDFHHYTSVFYGSACEYKHCPNDCSGTGSCNRISGECTCWDRYYDAEDPRNASTISSEGTAHFPCRKVICDDGPHPRSLIPDRPNLDAMQCGECAFADNSTQCAPVDFMSPTAMLALELDWDAIVVRNSFLRNNDSAYADMYDSSSPAAQEATQAIADEVNAVLSPLSLTAGLADITITCHICESGLEGSWSTTHEDLRFPLDYLRDLQRTGVSDAEVCCTTAEARALVAGGYGQALVLRNMTADEDDATADLLGNATAAESESPANASSGRRSLQIYSQAAPVVVSLGLQFSCPNNCSSTTTETHGVCDTATGRCSCAHPYFRDDCHFAACPGELAECSGAGTCDYNTGRCACILGRAGLDCNKPDVDCPNDCTSNMNGDCDRLTGVCTCTTYFMGEDCGQIISPCGEICPGRSFCNGLIGECECPPVTIRNRTFSNVLTYGYGCMLAPCLMPVDDENATDTTRETDCNAGGGSYSGVHYAGGECNTYSGECECNPGFLGLECQDRECVKSVDVYTNETVYCSGHGACNFTTGECMCNDDHDQPDCSRLLCPDTFEPSGYSDTCEGEVHPQANCNHDSGMCICDPGYIGGGRMLCDMKVCPGPLRNACSGRDRGSCNYTSGLCQCREGYTGELCELMFCPGDVGYPPPSWTETEAAARPKFRTADPHRDACDGHGECDPVAGTCSCDDRFSRGVDIEYRGIRSVQAESEETCSYRLCPNHCSGNGICDFSTGICDCYMEPYTGLPLPQPACAMTVCPLGPHTGLPCDARGDCNFATGECTCTQLGASGSSCSEMVCLNDCWGQGECERATGVCFCSEGWSGIDCGISSGRRNLGALTLNGSRQLLPPPPPSPPPPPLPPAVWIS